MNKGFQIAKRVKATLYQLFLESIFIAEKDIRGFAITYEFANSIATWDTSEYKQLLPRYWNRNKAV